MLSCGGGKQHVLVMCVFVLFVLLLSILLCREDIPRGLCGFSSGGEVCRGSSHHIIVGIFVVLGYDQYCICFCRKNVGGVDVFCDDERCNCWVK